MNIRGLGDIVISTVKAGDAMSIEVFAEHRAEPITGTTGKDESIDQFTKRLNGMLRALFNAQPRAPLPEIMPAPVEEKVSSWSDIKKKVGLK